MSIPKSFSESQRLFPTVAVIAIVLLAAWMGNASGGYFTSDWASAAFIMAALVLVASLTGVFSRIRSPWNLLALSLLGAYTVWSFASMLWAPNKGDAWLGAGQTLLYLLVFWITASLVALGSSRRWILIASSLGPAAVAVLTLWTLVPRMDELFENNRLIGTIGYYNNEAAFLLVPFWVSIYVAGSPRVNLFLRGAVLAGAVLCVDLAVLTQSRGAMVAMAVSLPVFFLLSGHRIRGLLALAPVVAALYIAFPRLNAVYLDFLNEESPVAALQSVLPVIWLTAAGAGLYGLLWGLMDQRWKPSQTVVWITGSLVLAVGFMLLAAGVSAINERVDGPSAFVQQRWEAFKADDRMGQEQSRYLSASGMGRYTYWQVAWKDFTSHPILGVGTHNYEATYYQLRDKTVGWVRQPHMLPLEVLAERGIVGGVLFFGFIVTCLSAGLSKRFRYLSSEGKAQVGAMSAAVTYWLVHSSADWLWQMPAVTLPAIAYLAILAASWRQAEESRPLRWPLRLVGAGIAVVAIAVIAPLYIADRYFAQSQLIANPWDALAAVERAQRFNPVDPRLPRREAELALEIGDWPRAEKALDEARRLNPEHYGSYKLLGMFYEKQREPEKALSLYHRASELNPLDEDLAQRVERLEGRGDRAGNAG